jgi:LysM repeat protein
VAPGTVVAVGEIQSSDGRTRGHVVLKNVVGDEYDLIVSGYTTNVGGERAVALARTATPTPDQCVLGTDSIQVGALAPGVDQVVTTYLPADETGGDPSNLTSLSFATPGGDTSGCGAPITAHAVMTWAFPAPYSDLTVVDGGATPGAEGAVTLAHGAPQRYTVAAGDTLTAVLDRFGLTIGELQYLNPGSFQKGSDSVPEQGFSWNLSVADR